MKFIAPALLEIVATAIFAVVFWFLGAAGWWIPGLAILTQIGVRLTCTAAIMTWKAQHGSAR